jgi:hypothetical protein
MRRRLAEHVVIRREPRERRHVDDTIDEATYWGPTVDLSRR